LTSYLLYILDSNIEVMEVRDIMIEFKDVLAVIQKINDPKKKTK